MCRNGHDLLPLLTDGGARDYSQKKEDPMAIRKLNPYLNFDGTAAKAIKLYEKALDAKPENVMPWPAEPGQKPTPETKDRIMHAVFHIGDGVVVKLANDCG